MSEHYWNTAGLSEGEQFLYWRDVVWDAFTPVSLTRAQPGPFLSSVRATAIGPLSVALIKSQTQSVARTPTLVEQHPGEIFFLNLPLSDGSHATQHGRSTSLRSGDFILLDGTKPFDLVFTRAFRQISVGVPHDVLAPMLVCPADVTGVRIAGDRGVGAVTAAAIRSLAAQSGSISGSDARALVNSIAGLVALAVGGVRKVPPTTGRALLLHAALASIDRSLADPQLSPAYVADDIGVSLRYLHKLFTDHGATFGQTVLTRRLECCHDELLSPYHRHRTIADIAARHGLPDSS